MGEGCECECSCFGDRRLRGEEVKVERLRTRGLYVAKNCGDIDRDWFGDSGSSGMGVGEIRPSRKSDTEAGR